MYFSSRIMNNKSPDHVQQSLSSACCYSIVTQKNIFQSNNDNRFNELFQNLSNNMSKLFSSADMYISTAVFLYVKAKYFRKACQKILQNF